MTKALILIVLIATTTHAAAVRVAEPGRELSAAVACAKSALRERAMRNLDPPEVVAKASFDQCLPLFRTVVGKATASRHDDPFSTPLSRGLAYQIYFFSLYSAYLPLAIQTVKDLRAGSPT